MDHEILWQFVGYSATAAKAQWQSSWQYLLPFPQPNKSIKLLLLTSMVFIGFGFWGS